LNVLIASFLFAGLDQCLARVLAKEIGAILILFCILAFWVYPWGLKSGRFDISDQAMIFSSFWGLSISAVLLTIIFFLSEVDKSIAVLDALSGAVLGWFLGIYVSPHSKVEKEAFTGYKSALAGLLSGVVLTKAQTFLSDRYSTGKDIHLRDAEYFLIFWISLGVCTATIYNARAYGKMADDLGKKVEDLEKKADDLGKRVDDER
jgi:hypothetical protein